MLTHLFPRWEGDYLGIWFLQLAELLTERGVNVHVVAPHFPRGKTEEDMHGVSVHRFKYAYPDSLESLAYTGEMHERVLHGNLLQRLSSVSYFTSSICKVIEVVRRYDIDLIQCFWVLPSGLIGILSKQFVNRPVATYICGTEMAVATKIGFLRSLVSSIFKHNDVIFTESLKHGPTSAEAAIQLGAPPEKIEILSFGVDLEVFHPVPIRKGLKKVIMYAGNLILEKGLVYLIEASKKVIEKHPDSEFILIGKGRDEKYLMKYVERQGVKDYFKFLGALPNTELPEYYSLADIFVLPTLFQAVPMGVREAQACGVCVVASDIGGVPEVIKDGKTGLLVKAGDSTSLSTAIIRLIEDEKLRRRLAANGKRYIEKYHSREAKVKILIKIYERLISK